MGERKSVPVTCNLEPSINIALMTYIDKTGERISSYIRSLIIADLKTRGALDDETIARALS